MIKTTRRNFLKGTAAAGTIAAFGGQAPFFKAQFANRMYL